MKPFWKSKTFWLNVVAVVLAITGWLETIITNTTLLGLVAGFNLVLRKLTDQPIALALKDDRPNRIGTVTIALALLAVWMAIPGCAGAPIYPPQCALATVTIKNPDGTDRQEKRWLCNCKVVRFAAVPKPGAGYPAGYGVIRCDGNELPITAEGKSIALPKCVEVPE